MILYVAGPMRPAVADAGSVFTNEAFAWFVLLVIIAFAVTVLARAFTRDVGHHCVACGYTVDECGDLCRRCEARLEMPFPDWPEDAQERLREALRHPERDGEL